MNTLPPPIPRREISNPSDRITIEYGDPAAADAAVLHLGRGAYGIEGDDGLPVFLICTPEGIDAWFQRKHGAPVKAFLESVSYERIAAALDTVRCEGERTSMNDIAGRAADLAKVCRQRSTETTKIGGSS